MSKIQSCSHIPVAASSKLASDEQVSNLLPQEIAGLSLATVSQAQAQEAACLNVGLPTSTAQSQVAWLALLEKCQGPFDHAKALWMFGGAVLVLLVAVLVYRLIPLSAFDGNG